jgi:hypothetical protein
MQVSENAIRQVLDGLVLNRKGRWVPLDEAIAEEDELYGRLAKGTILIGEEWVDITEPEQDQLKKDPGQTDAAGAADSASAAASQDAEAEEMLSQHTVAIEVLDTGKIAEMQANVSSKDKTEKKPDLPEAAAPADTEISAPDRADKTISQKTAVLDIVDIDKFAGKQLSDASKEKLEAAAAADTAGEGESSSSETEAPEEDEFVFEEEDKEDLEAMKPDTIRLELNLDAVEENSSPADDSLLAEEFSGAEPDSWARRRPKRAPILAIVLASICALGAAVLAYIFFFS